MKFEDDYDRALVRAVIQPKEWKHRRWYRRIKTTQERRISCSEEHKPFVRGKRNCRNLPTSWDDIRVSRRGYGWKAHKKFKKNWMKMGEFRDFEEIVNKEKEKITKRYSALIY